MNRKSKTSRMKKIIYTLLALIFCMTKINAQVPQGINYQTVVRNGSGAIISNQNVNFRLSVVSGSPTGTIVYIEAHPVATNSLGLVNLIIGQGSPLLGTFSSINWGSASHYLSVELDPAGGQAFQLMGTSQLMSVPYALSAGNSTTSMAQLTDVTVTGVADGQTLKWNSAQSKWLPANDIGGGTGDNWGTQIVQTNNTLTGNGTSGSPLAVNGVLTDNQTLSINGNSLSISNGNSITLPSGGGSGWTLTGNSGTNPNTNFIGTTDSVPLYIKVNNQVAGRIDVSAYPYLTSFGYKALSSVPVVAGDAGGCAAFGFYALKANTTGTANTGIGYQSLVENITGYNNTATGFHSLRNNIDGYSNSAYGSASLRDNTSGYRNAAFGVDAMALNTTGSNNAAFGYQALTANTIGRDNTAIGNSACGLNTTGTLNTAVGYLAMQLNSTATGNTAVGAQALQNTTGGYNTALGGIALGANTTGERNTAVGLSALSTLTSGSYNTGVGHSVDVDNGNRTNCILLAGNGNLSLGGNNRVRIGNSSMSSIGGQVSWTALSDERVKQNVTSDVKGLAFIMKLNPVTYNYSISQSEALQDKKNTTDWVGKYDIEKIRFSGFMAQQVEAAAKEAGYSFSGVDKPEDANGLWGLRYSEFTVPLVKAVQEQQAIIEQLMKEIEYLKSKID